MEERTLFLDWRTTQFLKVLSLVFKFDMIEYLHTIDTILFRTGAYLENYNFKKQENNLYFSAKC